MFLNNKLVYRRMFVTLSVELLNKFKTSNLESKLSELSGPGRDFFKKHFRSYLSITERKNIV